jgi:uncharacterized protein YdaU (DUF1376 family)
MANGKDPAFLFYPNDYLGGTLGMTFEEKGAYIELLMLQFNRGHMTKHMIGQTLGQSEDKIWPVIESKFILDDEGRYYNVRLEQEQEKRKRFSESRRNNRNGNNQYSKKDSVSDKTEGGHMTSHMEDENRNRNKDVINEEEEEDVYPFEQFWNDYDKKVGDKTNISKKWKKLKASDKLLIRENIPKYKASRPDKQFRKNPEAYLNNRSWLDEIIEQSKPQQPKQDEPRPKYFRPLN